MRRETMNGVILLSLYLICVSAVSVSKVKRQLLDGGSFWDQIGDQLDVVDQLGSLDCGGQVCQSFLDRFSNDQKGLFQEMKDMADTFKFVASDSMQLSPQEKQEMVQENQRKEQFGFGTVKDELMERDFLDEAIRSFSEETQEFRDAILNMTKRPNLFTPAIAKEVGLDMLCFMNKTELKAAADAMTNKTRAVMCARSAKSEDLPSCAAQVIAEMIDCSEYFDGLNVKPRGPAAEACIYGIMERKHFNVQNLTDADWDKAMLCIDGLEAGIIMQLPKEIIKRNLCKLGGLLRATAEEKEINLDALDFDQFQGGQQQQGGQQGGQMGENRPNFDSAYFSRCDKRDLACLENKPDDSGLSPDVLRAVVDRVTYMMRQENVSAYSSDVVQCLAPFLREFKPKDILDLPNDVLIRSLDYIKHVEFDELMQFEVIERMAGLLPPVGQWDKDMIIGAFKTIKYDVGVMEALNVSGNLMEAIKDMEFPEFEDEADGFLLGKVLRGAAEFLNAENLTDVEIVDIKKVLPIMGISIMERLNDTALMAVFQNISAVTGWPDDLGREMVSFAIKKFGGAVNIDGEKFEKLGSLGGYLRTDEIARLSSDVISNNIDIFNDLRLSKAGQKKILKKLESLGGNFLENAIQNGTIARLMKKMPLKKLKELGNSLGFNPEVRPMDVECDKSTCKEMFKLTKASGLGEISQNPRKYNMKTVKNMGKVACGMGCDEILAFPRKEETFKIIRHLGELRCLGEVEGRCMAYKIKSMMDFVNQTKLERLATRENVKSVAKFFKFFNASDLRRLPVERCFDVLSELGREDFSNVRREQLTELKNFALSCKNKEEGNSEITTDDMMLVGDIACGMEERDVARFGIDAITNMLFRWQARCVLQPHIVRALLSKVKQALSIGAADLRAKEMVLLGSFMTYLEDNEFAQLNRSELRKAIPRLMKQFKSFERMRELREMNYVMDLNDTEKAQLLAGKNAIFGAILDGIQSNDDQTRKKRSSDSLTCSEIKMLEDAAAQMTTSQISALADSEFVDCAATLGSNVDWTQAQKVALSEVAGRETVWGSHSTWSDDNIAKAGIMVQGLSASNIAMFNITSVDTLASLGEYSGWEATQLEAGYGSFLTNAKGGTIGDIDSTDLGSMGEFACGASVSQISSMSTAYPEASGDVGSLTGCSAEKQAAYADLAIATFGSDVTTWSESTVASVGNMVGGLSEQNLALLTESQIQSLSTANIGAIPATKFDAFSSAQIGAMSSSQAASISSDQQANMNSDALATLGNNGGVVVVDTSATTPAPGGGSGSGAACVSTSIAAVITLLVAGFIM